VSPVALLPVLRRRVEVAGSTLPGERDEKLTVISNK